MVRKGLIKQNEHLSKTLKEEGERATWIFGEEGFRHKEQGGCSHGWDEMGEGRSAGDESGRK